VTRAVLFAVILCALGGSAAAGTKLAPRQVVEHIARERGGGIRFTRTTYLGKGRHRRALETHSFLRAPRGRLMEHEVISHELGIRHHVEHQKSGRKIMRSYSRRVDHGVLHETLLGTRTLEPGELDD
jgi:hypothetical protein